MGLFVKSPFSFRALAAQLEHLQGVTQRSEKPDGQEAMDGAALHSTQTTASTRLSCSL